MRDEEKLSPHSVVSVVQSAIKHLSGDRAAQKELYEMLYWNPGQRLLKVVLSVTLDVDAWTEPPSLI